MKPEPKDKEIILVRRAKNIAVTTGLGMSMGMGIVGATAKEREVDVRTGLGGIGVDTRRYIEGLLGVNR